MRMRAWCFNGRAATDVDEAERTGDWRLATGVKVPPRQLVSQRQPSERLRRTRRDVM